VKTDYTKRGCVWTGNGYEFFDTKFARYYFVLTEDYQVPIFQTGPDKEGFNLGCYNNFLEVFGYNKSLWLLPVHSRLMTDHVSVRSDHLLC